MRQKKLGWLIAGMFAVPAGASAQTLPVPDEAVRQVTVPGIRASVRHHGRWRRRFNLGLSFRLQ